MCIIAEEQITAWQCLGGPPGHCVPLLKFKRRAQGSTTAAGIWWRTLPSILGRHTKAFLAALTCAVWRA